MGSRQSYDTSSSNNTNSHVNTSQREITGLMETMMRFTQPVESSILVQKNPHIAKKIIEYQKEFERMRDEFKLVMLNQASSDTMTHSNIKNAMVEMSEMLIRIAILMESIGGPRVESIVSNLECLVSLGTNNNRQFNM